MPEISAPARYNLPSLVFQPLPVSSYFSHELPAAPTPKMDKLAKAGAFMSIAQAIAQIPTMAEKGFEKGQDQLLKRKQIEQQIIESKARVQRYANMQPKTAKPTLEDSWGKSGGPTLPAGSSLNDGTSGGVVDTGSTETADTGDGSLAASSDYDPVASAAPFVKKLEGFNPAPYGDHKQTSIGYGTVAQAGDQQLSEEEATQRLHGELATHADRVKAAVQQRGLNLTPPQMDALVSFDYNTGSVDKLLDGAGNRPENIPARMALYDKVTVDGKKVYSQGLANRRQQEIERFNSGFTQATPAEAAPARAPIGQWNSPTGTGMVPTETRTAADTQAITQDILDRGLADDPPVQPAQPVEVRPAIAPLTLAQPAPGGDDLSKMLARTSTPPPALMAGQAAPAPVALGQAAVAQPVAIGDNSTPAGTQLNLPTEPAETMPVDRPATADAPGSFHGQEVRKPLEWRVPGGHPILQPHEGEQHMIVGNKILNISPRAAAPKAAKTGMEFDSPEAAKAAGFNPEGAEVIDQSGRIRISKVAKVDKPNATHYRQAMEYGVDIAGLSRDEAAKAIHEAQTKMEALPPVQQKAWDGIQRRMAANPTIKASGVMSRGFASLKAGYDQQNGSGDIAMKDGFLRLINPTMGVTGQATEGMKAARPLVDKLLGKQFLEKWENGGDFTPQERATIYRTAEAIHDAEMNKVRQAISGFGIDAEKHGLKFEDLRRAALTSYLVDDSVTPGAETPEPQPVPVAAAPPAGVPAAGGPAAVTKVPPAPKPAASTMPPEKQQQLDKFKAMLNDPKVDPATRAALRARIQRLGQ